MNTLWFLYTCSLLAITLVSCSLSLAVWMATRRRDCLVSAAGFVIYALELSFIFFDEYANGKYAYPQNFDLPLTHAFESAALSVMFTGVLWVWMLLRLHRPITLRRVGVPVMLYAVIAFVLVPKEGMSGTLQQWGYWTTRDLTLLLILMYALWRYRHADSEAERFDLARSRTFFRVAVVLTVCILVEDTYMILLYRPNLDSAFEAQFFWHLSERNISENVLMVACAVQLLRRNQRVLSMYFNHPPAAVEREDAQVKADAPAFGEHERAQRAIRGVIADARRKAREEAPARIDEEELESRVLLFGDDHRLSARERDVVRELLKGKDTQNIASALTISPGTVKAHLHRIYRKVGVSGREELSRTFWSS